MENEKLTLSDIRAANKVAGKYWFPRNTVRGFKTPHFEVYRKKIYFVAM